MNENIVKDVLADSIESDNSLFNLSHYLSWDVGTDKIVLDDEFELQELEAIVWWMKNKVPPSQDVERKNEA